MRYRQRKVSIAVVALLLVGWLGVVCQACLAHSGLDYQPAQTSEGSHCSDEAGHEPTGYNTGSALQPYGNACECDSVAAGIKPGAHKEVFNFNPVALVYGFSGTRRTEGPASFPVKALSTGFPALTPIGSYRVQIK